MTGAHAWLPHADCDAGCVRAGADEPGRPVARAARTLLPVTLLVTLLPVLLLPAVLVRLVPAPPRTERARPAALLQRISCRLLLRVLGVRLAVSGGPIRNLPGVLVVSGHVSGLDTLAIGAVLPGEFVAKAELVRWPLIGRLTRLLPVIPIDRHSLRRLPRVVDAVAERLRGGRTVVAFPEGTTWCGLARGRFRPALFPAAVDAGRPVQPLRLSYHHRGGRRSTVPAFVGDDTLLRSLLRVIAARRTVCRVQVAELQLPTGDRRELARRCQAAVHGRIPAPRPHRPVVAA